MIVNPIVSVIMPVRNEASFIETSLRTVLLQDYPSENMEVIVVDGMSTDQTRNRVLSLFAEYPNISTQVLENPGKIVPTAMNIGIRVARGEWIVRMDGHSEYPTNYLSECLETSQRTSADNVGGLFISQPPKDSIGPRFVQAITTHRFGVGNADYRLNAREGLADTVPYGCYRRSVFAQIGWYDERLVRNQDYELNARLHKAGGLVWRNPDIKIYYHNQSTFLGLLRQAIFTGEWNPWMWYVAPYSLSLRHGIPGLFVFSILFSSIVFVFSYWGGVLLLAIIIPYFILALLSAGQQAVRYGWWMTLLLPFMFLAYHLAYGLGTIWGILLLLVRRAPVQMEQEPWANAGRYRAWPIKG